MKTQNNVENGKKYIFISHVPFDSSYGAGVSASHLMRYLKQLYGGNLIHYEMRSLTAFFRSVLKKGNSNSHCVPLPWRNNFDGSLDFKVNLTQKLKFKLVNFLSITFSVFIFRMSFLCKKQTIIHLNSLVLIDLVRIFSNEKKFKIICHIREVCILEKATKGLIHNVGHFICIDDATRNSLQGVYGIGADKISVIPNPVSPLSDQKMSLFGKKSSTVNIGIVGQIFPHKGIELAINLARKLTHHGVELFIIGTTEQNFYAKKLIEETKDDNNVVWLGHIDQFFESGGYRDLDILLRADPDHRVGRTMYEGLISSNKLLIPLEKGRTISDPFLIACSDCVLTYRANDLKDLYCQAVHLVNDCKQGQNVPDSRSKLVEKFNAENLNMLRELIC